MFRKLIVFAVAIFFVPAFVHAWHVNTHLQMTRDAISLMPPEFQKSFTEHQKFVESGIKDPDEVLRDWQNHYYIPGPPPEGGAIDRIEKLSQVILLKFQNSTATDVSKQLCQLAHYIADLWEPESLIKQNTSSNAMFVNDNDLTVFYEGYKEPIANPREFFMQRAEWRWRLENSNQVSTLLYNEAVNDIARTWLTLWQQSGHKIETQPSAMIHHKAGNLNVNYENVMLEESVAWYIPTGNPIDAVQAHLQEMARLNEQVNPSDDTLATRAKMRNEQQMMEKTNPKAPFAMLETSLKKYTDSTYLIARVQNRSNADIPAISFMYPGVKGPFAQVENLRPGAVAKIEAKLPADATKQAIQIIFASSQ
jgi:hypothetical protein